jgi:hypothetical protein
MSEREEIVERIRNRSARERAAALAHWVYVRTTNRKDVDWELRVDSAWDALDEKAREFNMAAIDTWVQSPEVLTAWFDAITAYKNERRGEK